MSYEEFFDKHPSLFGRGHLCESKKCDPGHLACFSGEDVDKTHIDMQRVRTVLLLYCSCRKDVVKESLLSAELCVCCKILKELGL